MKKVLFRAPALSSSGYGIHCRQIFKWLISKPGLDVKVQVLPWGNTTWLINPDYEDGLIGEVMKRTVQSEAELKGNDLSIQVQLPNEWDTSLAKVNIGVTAGVETDMCNPEWIKFANRLDHLIVPSRFTKKTFTQTAIKNKLTLATPVSVINESFIESILDKKLEPLQLNIDTGFNFLLVGTLTGQDPENDRKNIFYTIKWFCEVFQNSPNVGLVIKTCVGRSTTIDRMHTENILKRLISEVRPGAFPKIHFLHGLMSDREIASLYKSPKIKSLLTLTRGEGYGLPIIESAASGLPIIATDWSAHTEYLGDSFTKIDYTLSEIPESRIDNNIFIKGARWANVKEASFKRNVVNFIENYEKNKKNADKLSRRIQKRYSHESISKRYDNILGEYLV